VTPIYCSDCRTELPPDTLACPACGALSYRDTLKRLAGDAESARLAGNLTVARDHWSEMLRLLPANSTQYGAIRTRIADATATIDQSPPDQSPAQSGRGSWSRIAGGAAATGLFLIGKLKFLLLGLTKASTFISMFAFFGVYWSIYGWPLALGLVVSIYIHEMGHVSMLRREGIDAGAPMFIPGMGAFVLLKQHIQDPLTDAKIGLAGPVWGLGAAIAASAIYAATGTKIWLAIAQLTGFINLFNLIPVWQLDGSRGMHVLGRTERWALVGFVVLALALTEQRLLFIVGAVAVWRAMQQEVGPGDSRVFATFAALIIALAFLARGVG
jgi:Zn-dependent protease